MSLDLLIPFIILLVLVVYLIFTRNRFEKKIVDIYEDKFTQWKKSNKETNEIEKECKQLVGLIYKEGYNITIELLDKSVSSKIEQGKFKIKDK